LAGRPPVCSSRNRDSSSVEAVPSDISSCHTADDLSSSGETPPPAGRSSNSRSRLKQSSEPSSSSFNPHHSIKSIQHQQALLHGQSNEQQALLHGQSNEQQGVLSNQDIMDNSDNTFFKHTNMPLRVADELSLHNDIMLSKQEDDKHHMYSDGQLCAQKQADTATIVMNKLMLPGEEEVVAAPPEEDSMALMNRSYGVEEVLAILEGLEGPGRLAAAGGISGGSALTSEDGRVGKPPWGGHYDRALNPPHNQPALSSASRGQSSSKDHNKAVRQGNRAGDPIRDLMQQQQGLLPLAMPPSTSAVVGSAAAAAAATWKAAGAGAGAWKTCTTAVCAHYLGQGSALVGGGGNRSKALVPYLSPAAAPSRGKHRIMSADGGTHRREVHFTP
jgi:hypothetical protein